MLRVVIDNSKQRQQLNQFIQRIESYQKQSILLIGPDLQIPGL